MFIILQICRLEEGGLCEDSGPKYNYYSLSANSKLNVRMRIRSH